MGFERFQERGSEGEDGKAQVIRSFPSQVCPTPAWKEPLTGLWEEGWSFVSSLVVPPSQNVSLSGLLGHRAVVIASWFIG